ncbi:hypothetical protein AB1Y20_017911 [Prymnesium parvum]|uniref:Trichome birefringence-like C-terminal domain-containing protein n=1 Tax=Prymnesium parvum TaxID=97485 RepID=A0AB34JQ38_PRYPA
MRRAEPRAHVLHTVFEDSLDGRWRSVTSGANLSEDGEDSEPGFCRRSLRLSFAAAGGQVWFYSRATLLGLDEPGLHARLSFLARPLTESTDPQLRTSGCPPPRPGEACAASVCVALRLAATPLPPRLVPTNASAPSGPRRKAGWRATSSSRLESEGSGAEVETRLPLCSPHLTPAEGGWVRVALPLASFRGAAEHAVRLTAVGLLGSAGELLVDDLRVVSEAAPAQVRTPFTSVPKPAYVALVADADEAKLPRGPGWCEYMSSEYRGTRSAAREAPRCAMDGDHLRGRWVQNCAPSHIRRPDVYAYGRPIPRTDGKFDFRMCFRASLWERMRAQLALSWTWRPYDCQMRRFTARGFDEWLGKRTLLLLGDSLTAQMYYSLLFLLGPAVLRQLEHHDGMKGGAPANRTHTHVPLCSTSAAEEGLSAFSEMHLAHGGRVVKVLGHNRYIQELQRAASAPWARFAREADVVMINVGHHYRYVDPTFTSYAAMVRAAERSLRELLKPSAYVLFRSTNLGHRGCEEASRPLRDRLAAWARLAPPHAHPFAWTPPPPGEAADPSRGNVNAARSNRSDPFDWRAPALHEGEWRRVFLESEAFRGRFAVLNVSFVDQRVDGHVARAMRYAIDSERKMAWGGGLDCLHYCFPGPIDFWVQALYNQLMQIPRVMSTADTTPRGASP